MGSCSTRTEHSRSDMAPLKLISWNVNGIRAAEKKGFLDWLGASGGDVVAHQETKGHPRQLSPALLCPGGSRAGLVAAAKKSDKRAATPLRRAPVPAGARRG